MKNQKIAVGITLFILGTIGVLSILTMDITLPEKALVVLREILTDEQIKYVILINPMIMMLVAVVLGTILHDKVGLKVPLIKSIVAKEDGIDVLDLVKIGIMGGVIAGMAITLVAALFSPHLPEEFLELGENLKPSLAARFLYGGLTEEIMMRFGLMTLIVWLVSKIVKKTNTTVYWIGILIAAVIFALGHFPIAYQTVGNPSVTLLSYILIGNTIGGIIFGWLYWKKGLEAAFIAHIFAHVVMLLAEPMVGSV